MGSSKEVRDDNDVCEGDWTGESKGEGDAEVDAEDGFESEVNVRCRAAFRGRRVVGGIVGSAKRGLLEG